MLILSLFLAGCVSGHNSGTSDGIEIYIPSSSSIEKSLSKDIKPGMNKFEISKIVGTALGDRAIKIKINKVAFDRNGYPYHGRIRALADAARESGLEF